MSYAYIERAYGLTFIVGQRVAFVEEGCPRREGLVQRPISSAEHYVAVLFDGDKHKVPCHPTSVEPILLKPAEAELISKGERT